MAAKKIILCDTNIFIDYFHDDEKVIKELDYLGFDRLAISVVSVAEIYFGMRKRETVKTRDLIRKFNLLHLDKNTSKLFIQFMLGYKDLGIAVPDALIAATTVSNNVELFTHNRKDFDFIEGLKLYNPRF
jgi:tRNA(fMet)-specific endonuclease VapC